MKKGVLPCLTIALINLYSCQSPSESTPVAAADTTAAIPPAAGSFGYDLAFIRQHDKDALVLQDGDAKLIVSPRYQAKVFTSTAAGDSGASFGWVHYKAFDGNPDPHMNAYGGEDRLWLGPEGGKFSLFFAPGAKMEFANWKTPADFDTDPWELLSHTSTSAQMQKNMQLTNYAGTKLLLSVTRSVTLFNRQQVDSLLKLAADTAVKVVGYQTLNILTNTGSQSWTEVTGMPCLWLLDMLKPAPATVIVIPYTKETDEAKGNPATTDYFGEIAADRIKFQDSVLFFKADGKSRGKLGIHPLRARSMAGSYDTLHQVLTLVVFDIASHAKYLNQEWNTVKPPFSGDAVNAYNDGPLADGSQMGPFYELESVSPAETLHPGASLTHHHSVFHFTGPVASLDMICRKTLGIPLDAIRKAF